MKLVFEGKEYIQGLHGVPPYDIYAHTKREDWAWKKGTTIKDNAFLPMSVFSKKHKPPTQFFKK